MSPLIAIYLLLPRAADIIPRVLFSCNSPLTRRHHRHSLFYRRNCSLPSCEMALPEANSRGHSLYVRNSLCSAGGNVGPTTCVRDHHLRWQVTCLCRIERGCFWKQFGFPVSFTRYRWLVHSETRSHHTNAVLFCSLVRYVLAGSQPRCKLHTSNSTTSTEYVSTSCYVQSSKIDSRFLHRERYAYDERPRAWNSRLAIRSHVTNHWEISAKHDC